MPSSTAIGGVLRTWIEQPDDATAVSRLEQRLAPVLSVIAGMVDLTGFFTLGNIFTAHITGNLVVAAAAAVHGGPWNLAQALAIPVFMLAVAAAWLVARASSLHGTALTRLLLVIQFLLLGAVLVFCVTTEPSANPHGLMAGIAVMVAVCAMAFQYALLHLALPKAVSTAVMTGNLTNAVLSLMEMLSPQQPLMTVDRGRLKRSLYLLIGFLVGCLVAAAAISMLGDLGGRMPTAQAAVAIAVR